jgi:hypothetical protein
MADGLGSAAYSEAGAQRAVETTLEFLRGESARLLGASDEIIRSICQKAVITAAEAVKSLPYDNLQQTHINENVRPCDANAADQYACTLTILLIAPHWIAAMLVGDGFVVWRPADSVAHQVFVAPEKGEFVNYTATITGSGLESAMRFELRRESPGFATASSDGLLYLALKSEVWTPHQPFFQFIESFARHAHASEDHLRELLGDPKVNELTDDDKSLLLVGARHAPSSEPDPGVVGAATQPVLSISINGDRC